MGFFDSMALSVKISKLKKYKSDLGDDYNAIQRYNGQIDSIISDYQSFIRTGSSGVTNKLYEYKEPYQYNDNSLTSASSYIQREINKLKREQSEND